MPMRSPRVNYLRLATVTVSFATLSAGCATLDTAQLDSARTAVEAGRADPAVDAARSPHMREAERLLKLAEKEVEDRGSQTLADQDAYLAEAHVQVARARAAARVGSEKKSRHLTVARREASAAEREAEVAEREARVAKAVLALAKRRAKALEANQTVRGMVLTLEGVSFGFDRADLKEDAKRSLLRLSGFLIALPDREVLVEGFTDNTGKEDYNLELSQRRAESVRDELAGNGVEAKRIVADGLGMAFPVASNAINEGREKTRRVEVLILTPGPRRKTE